MTIDWSKQHCGVHQAPFWALAAGMPDVADMVRATFPHMLTGFTWDVKVHLLMPRQYPCIPHWHQDNVPRENGVQRHELCRPELPMYLWLSGPPLTQFLHGYVQPRVWHKFSQLDQHRGSPAAEHGWRGFIRATHSGIMAPKESPGLAGFLRRHTQVYLDAETYQW
jgi:hypothetical protein